MEIELIKIYGEYAVIGLLAFMGFLSLWFWIERLIFFKTVDIYKYQNKKELEINLTKHIDIISTCGSNAPYVGLLGTVFGIMFTFYMMGQGDTREILIGDTLVEKEKLLQMLEGFDSKSSVIINSDKESRFEHFVIVLDALKQKGFENVGVLSRNEK